MARRGGHTEDVLTLSHDLRQPLATILVLSSDVAGRPDVPDDVRAALGVVVQESRALRDMLSAFLDQATTPQPTSIVPLARDVTRSAALRCAATVTFTSDGRPAVVNADAWAMRRAVSNLVDNAIRAAGDGAVSVEVRAGRTHVRVLVDDSGPGMGRIEAGHGLGLQLVDRVVKGCGGTLRLKPGPLGGVRAAMVLPTSRVEEAVAG